MSGDGLRYTGLGPDADLGIIAASGNHSKTRKTEFWQEYTEN